MARKVHVSLVDDLDQSDAAETVKFALDGANYEIDLSQKNAAELRDALATYVAHGRRAGRGSATPRATRGAGRVDREQTQAIREWARKNGHRVSDRGRIPSTVLEAYNSTH
ncbi:MAG: Lsr2 family protein [Actinomycetota bacterium]